MELAELNTLKGKTSVVRLIKRPIPLHDEDQCAREINSIFGSLKIENRRVRLNIPRHMATIRFLKLPSVDDSEISGMVKTESLKHIPYADEDVISGYRIVEKFGDGYSNVLIAIMQAEAVRKPVRLLKRAGLTVESAHLGSETLLLWHLASREGASDMTSMLVNVDSDHIDIDIVSGERLLFTRGVFYGSGTKASAERIAGEIKVSASTYHKESGSVIDKIILTGINADMDELKALVGEKMKIPVEVTDQMANFEKSPAAYLETDGASFAELLGLSAKYLEAQVNLLPENIEEEKKFDLVKKNIVFASAVLCLIAIIASGLVVKKLHDKKIYISRINAELAKIGPKVKKAKQISREIGVVTEKMSERPLAIDLVSEIFRITPGGVSLAMMEYESGKAVALRGIAPSLSDAFKYVATLEKSQYFENVKVRYANKRLGTAAGETADFEIVCPIARMK